MTLSDLVAIEVMKWEKVNKFPRMDRSDGRTLFFEGRVYKVEDDDGQVSRNWEPLKNRIDTWQMVDKMRSMGWQFSIVDASDRISSIRFFKNNLYIERVGKADSAADRTELIAICLAALRAMEISESTINATRVYQNNRYMFT